MPRYSFWLTNFKEKPTTIIPSELGFSYHQDKKKKTDGKNILHYLEKRSTTPNNFKKEKHDDNSLRTRKGRYKWNITKLLFTAKPKTGWGDDNILYRKEDLYEEERLEEERRSWPKSKDLKRKQRNYDGPNWTERNE